MYRANLYANKSHAAQIILNRIDHYEIRYAEVIYYFCFLKYKKTVQYKKYFYFLYL